MSDRPPCAVEPPNCCVKTIGFLSPCPKCGHISSGFAVGKDAAMRRAEQAIKLIADGVVRAVR